MVDTLKRKLFFEFFFIFIIIPLLVILNNEKLFVFITLLLFFYFNFFAQKYKKFFLNLSKKTDWKYICFFSCMFIIAGFIYTIIIDKNLLFNLPVNNFSLWVIVILIYPFFSVIPQEFIFRVLFFERYENLLSHKILLS